jgi:hypothetical protein
MSEEKKRKVSELLKKREHERKILESRIKNNRLVFKNLNGITCEERRIFLGWLSAGLNKENKGGFIKNEFGRYFKVEKSNDEQTICIKCEDGEFFMPPYELVFKEEK